MMPRPSPHFLVRHVWRFLLALGVLIGAFTFSPAAWTQGATLKDFDHTKTGFALTGVHARERCESCHVNGVFKGTPRDCETCHLGGNRLARNNVVKPVKHIPTTQTCDTCHTTSGFAGARFSHVGVQTGTCTTCHNGNLATGKPAGHLVTSASCDACHRTSAWHPAAGMDHSTVSPGTCATCHNGSRATGRPGNHVPVGSTACDSCHATGSWKPTRFNHTQLSVASQCSTCHTGAFPPADGRPATHVPYGSLAGVAITNCDSCHKAGFATWAPAKVHANVGIGNQCATCHTGSFPPAVGKPNTPIHAGQTVCETCHRSTVSWTGAKPDHATFTAATNCASCHNGSAATGRSAQHVPIGSANCTSCHAVASWKPANWNHTQVPVAAQCATCHSGAYPPADGRPATHIPYTGLTGVAIANCDSCHKAGFAAWAPAKFHANVSVSSQCGTCHTGTYPPAVGKPNTPIHAGQTVCENCHKSTASWAAGKPDHSTFTAATNCASCHNGSAAGGRPSTHIPVGTLNCTSCHSTSTWKPSSWNHTQTPVAAQCSTCHSGAYPPADGRPATHIPYTALTGVAITNCDSCHKAGFAAWTPAKFHASVSVSNQCATCHTGNYPPAVGKPSTPIHATVTTCEGCHKSTASWAAAKPDHSTFTAATNCASCHNGSAAGGRPGTHIPVGALNCTSCHSTSTWKPSSWNHTQTPVAAQCSTCHSGAYPPADGRPATHIPYTALTGVAITNCDSCHKAGFAAWAPAKFHSNVSVSSQCGTCHTGTYPPAVGKPNTAIHAGQTVCENCHKNTASWIGAKPDHSTFTAATVCGSCHNGTAASGRPSTHIPVGATNCLSCHTTTAWKPSRWNHTQMTVIAQCATCHTGSYPPADGRPTTHIPYTGLTGVAITNCDSCHKAGFAAWTPARFHASVTVSNQCATCHTGSYPPAVGKPNTPVHTGVTTCEACHKSTASWATVSFVHPATAAVGTGTCDTCHNGTTARGKSTGHIPVTTGPTKCDSCHKSQASFATAVTMNHTVVTATPCKTCHNGQYLQEGTTGALAKPALHIPETALLNGGTLDCSACHTSTASWGTMRMNHNGSLGGGAGWCKDCHASSTRWLGSMEKKSLTHRTKTPPAIDCSESGCHRPLGSKGSTYTKWD